MMRWLTEVKARKVHRRDIVDPGPGFVMLERELATALVAILLREIKQTVQHLRAKTAAKKRLLGGRDILLEI